MSKFKNPFCLDNVLPAASPEVKILEEMKPSLLEYFYAHFLDSFNFLTSSSIFYCTNTSYFTITFNGR